MSDPVTAQSIIKKAAQLRETLPNTVHDQYVEQLFAKAGEISQKAVKRSMVRFLKDEKIDRILTSKLWGVPSMIALFTLVIWLTIVGSNVPSSMLANLFLEIIHPVLKEWTVAWPWWLSGLLVDGMYLATQHRRFDHTVEIAV